MDGFCYKVVTAYEHLSLDRKKYMKWVLNNYYLFFIERPF